MSLASYLNQPVTHFARATYDAYGRETYTTGTTYPARVELFTKQMILPNGEVSLVDGRCFVEGNPGINIDDKIVYDSVDYRVFGKKTNVDGQGNIHHLTLTLQKIV